MVTDKSRRQGSATAQELDFYRKKRTKEEVEAGLGGCGGVGGDVGVRGL